MRRILRLILIAVATFVIVKGSIFGCTMRKDREFTRSQNNAELVKRLESHVYALAQNIGERSVFQYEKLVEAQEYIAKQFQSYGYAVEYQEYKVDGKAAKNIIATKRGLGVNIR